MFGATSSASYSVWNDDALTASVGDATVTEPASGTVNASFTVTLNAASTQYVYVYYATANNTATAGSDYTAKSGSITFAPGVTSLAVTVTVQTDAVYEPGNETFFFNLTAATNATIGDGQGVGTIIDNPPPPTLSFGTINSVTEGDNGSVFATVPVVLSRPVANTVSLSVWATSNTAAAAADFVRLNQPVSFAPGETTQWVTVEILPDTISEGNETAQLTLVNPVNATIPNQYGFLTIVDNDPVGAKTKLLPVAVATVRDAAADGTFETLTVPSSGGSMPINYDRWSSNPANHYESRGVLEYNVSSALALGAAQITFDFSSGSAYYGTERIDGYSADGTVTLADATTPGTFLGAFDTKDAFPSMSVTLDRATVIALAGPTGFIGLRISALRPAQGDITGFNLTAPTATNGPSLVFYEGAAPVVPNLTVSDVSQAEGTGGTTNYTFTLTLSQATTVPVTVTYSTANGTALAGSDYTAASGYLIFHPGQTTKTVTVSVSADATPELAETFSFNVTGSANAAMLDGTGLGTLADDDNRAPTANAGPDKFGSEGQVFAFSGTGSTDPDGHALTYSWNFGDGTTGTGATPSHAYADQGTYTVTLTVSDGFGGVSTDTADRDREQRAPTADRDGAGCGGARPAGDVHVLGDGRGRRTRRPGSSTRSPGRTARPRPSAARRPGCSSPARSRRPGGSRSACKATDKDAAEGGPASQSVEVTLINLQMGYLYVGGTTGDDHIVLRSDPNVGTAPRRDQRGGLRELDDRHGRAGGHGGVRVRRGRERPDRGRGRVPGRHAGPVPPRGRHARRGRERHARRPADGHADGAGRRRRERRDLGRVRAGRADRRRSGRTRSAAGPARIC